MSTYTATEIQVARMKARQALRTQPPEKSAAAVKALTGLARQIAERELSRRRGDSTDD
ncbi:hypothetical protein MT344_04095 [Clavibacter michiganensis subsp. phaseoli]|uniref:hypothetical protein n=1 Tax=Clavibacter phaseoli TaxID=1734031 RepID=UPI001FB44C53|nr:hypothetical protein [Clavibacter phaseoli]MCJ1710364.1 hypothetical protein [Clavibacter phaseoli]